MLCNQHAFASQMLTTFPAPTPSETLFNLKGFIFAYSSRGLESIMADLELGTVKAGTHARSSRKPASRSRFHLHTEAKPS